MQISKKMENIMKKICVSAFGLFILMFTAVVWAAPVPDTGQTKCYNNTVEIPCPSPGQPFYGQDANYTINPAFYTKLDSSGKVLTDSAASWSMVKDNVTGLIWENKTEDGSIHDKDNTCWWYDPLDPNFFIPGNGMNTMDFIDTLNISHFGGYSEWRIPTIKELGTIINYDISGPGPKPTINTYYFSNTQASFYWSATSFAYSTSYAWGVDLYNGYDNHNPKSLNYYVRAVRGLLDDVSTAAGGYADNGDGTVTDTSTGLMWQQAGSSNGMTWEQALAYCEELNLGGHTDWRLPAKKVLRSLVDFSRYDPSINTVYFPDTISSFYWSSTTDAFITDLAWGVYFYVGDDAFNSKLDYGYVRAVRGGQAPTPTQTECSATLDENLLLHIPNLFYVNQTSGSRLLWADLVYEFNPTYPTLILFKLTNAGIINNPAYLCTTTKLSAGLNIHIPDVLLPDGITHLWVDLEYCPALSTDVNLYFVVVNYGAVSN